MNTLQTDLTPAGPRFSRLVPGLMRLPQWRLSSAELLGWIKACLEQGLTTFDHADIYGAYTCEELFGRALALEPSIREQMQLVTKCGIKLVTPARPDHRLKSYDTGRAHILASVENSLRALHTDRIDLLLIHRPDPLMDADEVAEAFGLLRQEGKVLHFGVSNFTPAQFDLLASRLDFPLVTNQVEFSLLHMDPIYDDTFDQCQRLRARPMIWSPLAGGALFRDDDPDTAALRAALEQVGQELGGAAVDQVALAWVLRHPVGGLPVLGTGRMERIRDAVAAAALEMTREQWFTIWQAAAGEEVP